MKFHFGIYDTFLREWVTKPADVDPITLDKMCEQINREHSKLAARHRIVSSFDRFRIIAALVITKK